MQSVVFDNSVFADGSLVGQQTTVSEEIGVRRWILALTGLLIAVPPIAVGARETGFINRVLKLDGQPHRYVVYVPAVGTAVRLPAILALHGAGERGDDGLAPTDVGLGHAIRVHPERFPAVVVFPQVPAGSSWLDSRRLAVAALVTAQREFHTDPERVYAVGLSMGGQGTWALAQDDPTRFSAIVVVCGFIGPLHEFRGLMPVGQADPYTALAHSLATLPVWIVHGDADLVVPVTESRKIAAALRKLNGDVHYNELPGVGHNAWDAAFADPDLPIWLFQQRRHN